MNGVIRQQQSGGGNSAVCHNSVSATISGCNFSISADKIKSTMSNAIISKTVNSLSDVRVLSANSVQTKCLNIFLHTNDKNDPTVLASKFCYLKLNSCTGTCVSGR
jgi:hypothetical protein